jgi:hypothetical protein
MATSPTLDYLLGQMAQDKEVLNGWDAVLNVLESSLNTFFQTQFRSMTSGGQTMTLAQVFCGPRLVSPHGDYCVVTQFSLALAAPSFVFADGSNTVEVTQAIVSGVTRAGTMAVDASFQPSSCSCTLDDGRVTWGPAESVSLGSGAAIVAKVPLTSVKGLLNANTHTVVLDFATGAFTLNNITLKGVSSQELSDQIKGWFMTHGMRYQLASLDFSTAGSIPSLTPTQFRLNVLKTNSGNVIVQILITTNGSPAAGSPIVLEPIPTASGYTCTIMISSRIAFTDILCAGFNRAGKPFSLCPQSPAVAEGYSAYIAPMMHFCGSFSYGNCCDRTTVTYSLYLGGTYTGTANHGFFLHQSITPQGNVGNTITVSANNPVKLTGSGAAQSIHIDPEPPTVDVTGGASGTINDKLKAILNDDFKGAMAGISFGSVSYFALRTVLFPGSALNMGVVQVPTDLLIAGTLTPT